MNQKPCCGVIIYAETSVINEIMAAWSHGLLLNEQAEAEFPPTHSFLSFYSDLELPGQEQLIEIIDALTSLKEVNIDENEIDVTVSVILTQDGDGISIPKHMIRALADIGVSIVARAE